MLSGAPREDTGPEGDWLDASKIDTFHLCPTKYYYRYEQHLVPASDGDEVGTGMAFGFAIHKSLESLYRGTGFDLVPCPCQSVLQEDGTTVQDTSRLCIYCKGNPVPRIAAEFLGAYTQDPEDPRNPRTRNRGLELLEGYLTRWRHEPFSVEAVEVPFELDFPSSGHDDPFKYIGRMDLIIRWEDTVMPNDHKTTSRFGDMFDRQFKLSTQVSGYIVATHLTTGEEVTQAMINALRITSVISPDESFRRIVTTRTPEDIANWKAEAYMAMRAIRAYRESRNWPKHAPFSCTAYNRVCEYYNLCTSGATTREVLMKNAYKVSIWNPREEL